jgi:HSP20 family molecular chaperone IbpA
MNRTVAIDQIADKQNTSQLLTTKMSRLLEQVRNRAYELFDKQGREDGHNLDHWLQAENELGMLPVAKIDETNTEIRLRIERSGFSADQLKIYAEAQAVTVEGSAIQTVESDDSRQTNVNERALFGRYELPDVIDTSSVTATLQNGVLEVVARRAESPADQKAKGDADERPLKTKPQKDKSAAA